MTHILATDIFVLPLITCSTCFGGVGDVACKTAITKAVGHLVTCLVIPGDGVGRAARARSTADLVVVLTLPTGGAHRGVTADGATVTSVAEAVGRSLGGHISRR